MILASLLRSIVEAGGRNNLTNRETRPGAVMVLSLGNLVIAEFFNYRYVL